MHKVGFDHYPLCKLRFIGIHACAVTFRLFIWVAWRKKYSHNCHHGLSKNIKVSVCQDTHRMLGPVLHDSCNCVDKVKFNINPWGIGNSLVEGLTSQYLAVNLLPVCAVSYFWARQPWCQKHGKSIQQAWLNSNLKTMAKRYSLTDFQRQNVEIIAS